jgi:hypothetical protein
LRGSGHHTLKNGDRNKNTRSSEEIKKKKSQSFCWMSYIHKKVKVEWEDREREREREKKGRKEVKVPWTEDESLHKNRATSSSFPFIIYFW